MLSIVFGAILSVGIAYSSDITYEMELNELSSSSSSDILGLEGPFCVSMNVVGYKMQYLVHDGSKAFLADTCTATWYTQQIYRNRLTPDEQIDFDIQCQPRNEGCALLQTERTGNSNNKFLPSPVPFERNDGKLSDNPTRQEWYNLVLRRNNLELLRNSWLARVNPDGNDFFILCGSERDGGGVLNWASSRNSADFCGWDIKKPKYNAPVPSLIKKSSDLLDLEGPFCISMDVSDYKLQYLVHDGERAFLADTCTATWYTLVVNERNGNIPFDQIGDFENQCIPRRDGCVVIQTERNGGKYLGSPTPFEVNKGKLSDNPARQEWYTLFRERSGKERLWSTWLDVTQNNGRFSILCAALRNGGGALDWGHSQNDNCPWDIKKQ